MANKDDFLLEMLGEYSDRAYLPPAFSKFFGETFDPFSRFSPYYGGPKREYPLTWREKLQETLGEDVFRSTEYDPDYTEALKGHAVPYLKEVIDYPFSKPEYKSMTPKEEFGGFFKHVLGGGPSKEQILTARQAAYRQALEQYQQNIEMQMKAVEALTKMGEHMEQKPAYPEAVESISRYATERLYPKPTEPTDWERKADYLRDLEGEEYLSREEVKQGIGARVEDPLEKFNAAKKLFETGSNEAFQEYQSLTADIDELDKEKRTTERKLAAQVQAKFTGQPSWFDRIKNLVGIRRQNGKWYAYNDTQELFELPPDLVKKLEDTQGVLRKQLQDMDATISRKKARIEALKPIIPVERIRAGASVSTPTKAKTPEELRNDLVQFLQILKLMED